MKRIVAAIVSLLIGAFGITCIDQEARNRIDELERDNSIIHSQISSLEETTKKPRRKFTTTTRKLITAASLTTIKARPTVFSTETTVTTTPVTRTTAEYREESTVTAPPTTAEYEKETTAPPTTAEPEKLTLKCGHAVFSLYATTTTTGKIIRYYKCFECGEIIPIIECEDSNN